MNPQLIEYIRQQRATGVSDETIKINLMQGGGWTLDDVASALSGVMSTGAGFPDASDKKKLKFLIAVYLLSFVIISGIVFVQLKSGVEMGINSVKNSLAAPYNDGAGRFTISPPNGWMMADVTLEGSSGGKVFSPDKGRSMISIILLPVENSNPTISEVGNYIKSLAMKDAQYQLVSEDGEVTVVGHHAYRFQYTTVEEGVKNKREVTVVLGSNNVYLLTLSAPESEWGTFEQLADKSVATFTIK